MFHFKFKVLTIILSCFLSSGVFASIDFNFSPLAIYGDDNRQELFLTAPQWKEIGRSIAGKVSVDNIVNHNSYYQLEGILLGRKECPSNRFANEITVPSCTGFLVKPNMLVTAAHCMKTQEDCNNFYWVFEYVLTNAGDSNYTKVEANRVYKCSKVVSRVYNNFGDTDYAIIQLDRDVENRKPLALGFDFPIALGQALINIGHSNGLPLKFKDAAKIINIKSNQLAFESDMDTFHGDSGSPIFDANSGLVIGITSSGHADHFHDGSNTCRQLKVCKPSDNCHWSTTSRISNLKNEPIFKTQE